MAILKILIPDDTRNYVKNPSFQYDTVGWSTQGATLARVQTQARFGYGAGSVTTTGAALHEGIYFRVSTLENISDVITVSVYVRGNGTVRLRLDDNSPGGNEYTAQGVQLTTDRWTRMTLTGRSHGGDDLRLYVETDESNAVVRTFYVDGAQLERKPYVTTYCDGDQKDCRWTGIYHNSESSRPETSRAGGRWFEISGPEREAEDLYMTVAGGLGMAALRNTIQEYAIEAGGFHQGVKVGMRPMTFTFHAKHQTRFRKVPVSLTQLHSLRQMLIDLVKPDRVPNSQPLFLEYQDGDIPLYFEAYYDGGLEGEWDVRNGYVNSFPLRLVGVQPYFLEDSSEAAQLDIQEALFLNGIFGRINGVYSNMNYGVTGTSKSVYAIRYDARGTLWIAGNFDTINANAAALDPNVSAKIAYWDGEKWVAFEDTCNGTIYGIEFAQNGDMYVCGTFTSIGGVAANRIAYWDGLTWNAMGTGLSAECFSMCFTQEGGLFAAGNFTTAGGLATRGLAYWDGTKWNRTGQYGGLGAAVQSVVLSPDGQTLYVGGNFINESGGGLSLLYVASYSLSTGTFSAMGSGFPSQVYKIYVSNDGTVYATSQYLAAYWDGTNWNTIGSGFVSPILLFIDYSPGRILLGQAGLAGIDAPDYYAALWNGSNFLPLDHQYPKPAGSVFSCVEVNRQNGDFFIGLSSVTGTAQLLHSGYTHVNNPGTAAVFPVFRVQGPGWLRTIENQTTGKSIYFDLYLQESEKLIIDVGQGRVYTEAGMSLLHKMLGGSDFRSFLLQPGDNLLAFFISGDVGAQAHVYFRPVHWSVDATATREYDNDTV